MVKPLAMSP